MGLVKGELSIIQFESDYPLKWLPDLLCHASIIRQSLKSGLFIREMWIITHTQSGHSLGTTAVHVLCLNHRQGSSRWLNPASLLPFPSGILETFTQTCSPTLHLTLHGEELSKEPLTPNWYVVQHQVTFSESDFDSVGQVGKLPCSRDSAHIHRVCLSGRALHILY